MEEDNFHKQRRNLILLSFAIIFYNITGAEISNINLLGNDINLPNNEILPAILFLMLIYFIIRYGQYAHAIKDKNILSTLVEAKGRYIGILTFRELDKAKSSQISDARANGIVNFRPICILPARPPGIGNFPLLVFEKYDKSNQRIFDTHVHVSRTIYTLGLIKAYLYLISTTHFFTEYFFPILLCVICLLTFNNWFSDWFVGSLIKLTHLI